MKRWRAIVGLVGSALAVAVAVTLWPRVPRPCRATFEQVREGMTFEDVCATVGAPPGDYSGMGISVRNAAGTGPAPPNMHLWAADDTTMVVTFGDDGRVSEVSFGPTFAIGRASRLDRVLDRLGF